MVISQKSVDNSIQIQTIGLLTKQANSEASAATRHLADWLNDHGIHVALTEEAVRTSDMVAVIGGDGTFIAAARMLVEHNVPLLGINMGRLGFLTEVSMSAMESVLKEILDGRYRVEQRMILSASVHREEEVVAHHRVLNDVVAHKGQLARMMEFEVFIDHQFVFSSRADGLIVSTPTGSTAYALSAGGPIVHPALNAILLAPICPHTLSNRPIVVPGDGEIIVRIAEDGIDRLLTLDGQTGFTLMDGDQILIRKSQHTLKVLHSLDRNYYGILREKLRWGRHAGQ